MNLRYRASLFASPWLRRYCRTKNRFAFASASAWTRLALLGSKRSEVAHPRRSCSASSRALSSASVRRLASSACRFRSRSSACFFSRRRLRLEALRRGVIVGDGLHQIAGRGSWKPLVLLLRQPVEHVDFGLDGFGRVPLHQLGRRRPVTPRLTSSATRAAAPARRRAGCGWLWATRGRGLPGKPDRPLPAINAAVTVVAAERLQEADSSSSSMAGCSFSLILPASLVTAAQAHAVKGDFVAGRTSSRLAGRTACQGSGKGAWRRHS